MTTDRSTTKRLAGAMMLGVATVLVPKADPEAHWSTPPVAAVDVVVRADDWSGLPDVDALLAEFYEKFYGPAARPMAAYWAAIFKAWNDTIVTEHEHFVAPAIYTPQLLAELRRHLESAEQLAPSAQGKSGRNEKLYGERMRFTRLGFEVLDAYLGN